MKAFVEGLGFVVKGEIGGCDLVAVTPGDRLSSSSANEERLNLELVLRGRRAPECDEVKIAPAFRGEAVGGRATRASAISAGLCYARRDGMRQSAALAIVEDSPSPKVWIRGHFERRKVVSLGSFAHRGR